MGLTPANARAVHLAILIVVSGAGVAALLGILRYYGLLHGPLGAIADLVTSCPYSAIVNTPCPLCGTTGAIALLFAGKFQASISANPLGIASLSFGITQVTYRALRVARPRFTVQEELLVTGAGLAAVAVLLLVASG